MPETYFTAETPDGSRRSFYSPSTVIKSFFNEGQIISSVDFVAQSREALTEASERVRKKFGFACTAASASLGDIEDWVGDMEPEDELKITFD